MSRLSRKHLMAVLLAACFCLACNGKPTSAESTTINPDESRSVLKSNTWKNYHAMWDKIDALKEAPAADSLFNEIDDMESELDTLFSNDTALVNDLLMILRDKLSNKEKMLRAQRGRPPKPDWVNLLKHNTAHLAAELRVVEGFSARAITDPWVTDVLFRDMALYAKMVAQGIDEVRLHTPPEIESNDIKVLLENADDTLNRARAVSEEMGK